MGEGKTGWRTQEMLSSLVLALPPPSQSVGSSDDKLRQMRMQQIQARLGARQVIVMILTPSVVHCA